MDYAALRAELNAPAYAGLSNAAAALAVMQATVTASRTVPSAEVARLWARRGVLAAAREAGERSTVSATRQLGWRTLQVVEFDVLGDLDTRSTTDRAEFGVFLDALVSASIMSAGDRAATIALVTKPRLGRDVFGEINESDVAVARAL